MEPELRIIEPKVHIKFYDADYLYKIWSAARNCYFKGKLSELDNEFTEQKAYSLIEKLIKMGHNSCLEHVNFTIHISGVSRSYMAQITRHRHVTFHISSQHFQNHKDFLFVMPKFKSKIAKAIFLENIKHCDVAYTSIIELGEPHFIARQVLPNCVSCKIIMTLNLRELRHIIRLRKGPENVPEMQEVTKLIILALNRIDPILLYKLNGGK